MNTNYNNTYNQINNSLAKIIAIRSLLAGKELTNDEFFSLKGIKVVNDFLEAPLNGDAESKLKKAFVAAVIAAREFGHININGNYTTEELTLALSEGLTRLKTQYLVGKGSFDGNSFDVRDAKEIELDHAMVALLLIVERQIDNWCDQLPDKLEELTEQYYDELVTGLMVALSGAIAAHLSPELATRIMPWINHLVLELKPKVQEWIRQGAETIINYLKPEIINAVKKGLVILQKVKNWLLEGSSNEEEKEQHEMQQEEQPALEVIE